ncbi:MAG: hypothetical protein VYD81_08455, partial [Planctomycetota bacterium]|nr:hypothetical protein [Planctomycetota bacterium]
MSRDIRSRDHSADHYYRSAPQAEARQGRAFQLLRGLSLVTGAIATLALSFFYLSPAPGEAKEDA